MYKSYITVGLIIVILAFGTFWYSGYIHKSSDSLVQKLDEVELFLQSQEFEKGTKQMDVVEKEWQNTKKMWSVLLHHQEIDNIDISMKKLEKYVDEKSTVLGMAELSALRLLFEHIADTETFSIQNIF